MLRAMEDTLQCLVGERSSIRILLPFENENTSRKLFPKKPQPKLAKVFLTNVICSR